VEVRGPLGGIEGAAADLVLSRDVVLHCADPRAHLAEVYALCRRYLVLRLRTRDQGATVYDLEQSCMYYQGGWVPYIVFNTDDLVDVLRALEPAPRRIVVRKYPTVLGGHNGRYLPKELYLSEIGGAQTAVLVEKGTGGETTEVSVTVAPEPDAATPLRVWLRRCRRAFGW